VDTKFARGAPYKIWVGKKRPKFGAIFGNFRLSSRISPEWIDISKIGNYLINYVSSPIGGKKFGELWSTNKKSYRHACCPTQVDLFGILKFRP